MYCVYNREVSYKFYMKNDLYCCEIVIVGNLERGFEDQQKVEVKDQGLVNKRQRIIFLS